MYIILGKYKLLENYMDCHKASPIFVWTYRTIKDQNSRHEISANSHNKNPSYKIIGTMKQVPILNDTNAIFGKAETIVRRTYKSLLSKHCSQKSALLGCRTRNAEVDMVLGNPPVAPIPPALRAGELMPALHLFRPPPMPQPPPVKLTNSIKPPLESDIAT